MHTWNFKMEAVELAIKARLLNENSHHGYSIWIKHLKQISEFSETLFPSHSQAGYHDNCVPYGSWVHYGEVFKATWSEELSDKCAVVIYVWNKELYIIKPNCETDKSLEYSLWLSQRNPPC